MAKTCDKCGVTVRGTMQKCPLCQHKLTEHESASAELPCYPVIKTLYRQFERYFKAIILTTVAIGVAAVAVNMILSDTGFWSLFVLLGILCFWIMLTVAARRRYNIPSNITNQAVLISILSLIWDFTVGWRGWSVDFVIPITFGTAILSIGVIGQILHLPSKDYMAALLADALFGVVPVILYFTGVLNVRIPSVICTAVSLISFFAILIFEGRNMLVEIHKRVHL